MESESSQESQMISSVSFPLSFRFRSFFLSVCLSVLSFFPPPFCSRLCLVLLIEEQKSSVWKLKCHNLNRSRILDLIRRDKGKEKEKEEGEEKRNNNKELELGVEMNI